MIVVHVCKEFTKLCAYPNSSPICRYKRVQRKGEGLMACTVQDLDLVIFKTFAI